MSEAYEALNGSVRISLPSGKTLVASRPLLFRAAVRWLELLDRFNAGEAYGITLGVVLAELPGAVGLEDPTLLDELTMAEVVDQVIYRFLSHRRGSAPPWLAKPSESASASP